MITKLTALQYGKLESIKDVICVGNAVDIVREPKYDKEEGLAYKAICKDVEIGYIPLIPTLKKYWKDAKSVEAQPRVAEWGRATKAVRTWLESREKYQDETKWTVRISEILYKTTEGTFTTEDTGEPAQISVDFVDVIDW